MFELSRDSHSLLTAGLLKSICCSIRVSSGKAADTEEHSATWMSPFAEFSPRPPSSVFTFLSDSIASLTIYGRWKGIIKTTNFWLFVTQAKQFHILSGLLLTSKSHHSSCSLRQSSWRTVDLPELRVVCLNCWEGTRPKIVCHQSWQCWLFLPGKSGEHSAEIFSSKVKRADLRMLRWFPMGSSAKHKVDPSLSSSNAFWAIIPQKWNFMEANSVFGVCCFAAAVHNTSIRHNEPSFSQRWLSRPTIP